MCQCSKNTVTCLSKYFLVFYVSKFLGSKLSILKKAEAERKERISSLQQKFFYLF